MRNLPAPDGCSGLKEMLDTDAKKYGVKEKDQVVAHILNLLLTGKLRSGDRVDRNEIAHGLGSAGFPSKRRWFNSNTTALCRLAITAARSSSGSTSPPSWNITNSTACSTALPLPAQPPTPRLGSWASSTQSCDRCATQGVAGLRRMRVGVPAHGQRRVRRTAAARHHPGLTEPDSASVLDDIPKQPRRRVAVLRGRERRNPSART